MKNYANMHDFVFKDKLINDILFFQNVTCLHYPVPEYPNRRNSFNNKLKNKIMHFKKMYAFLVKINWTWKIPQSCSKILLQLAKRSTNKNWVAAQWEKKKGKSRAGKRVHGMRHKPGRWLTWNRSLPQCGPLSFSGCQVKAPKHCGGVGMCVANLWHSIVGSLHWAPCWRFPLPHPCQRIT